MRYRLELLENDNLVVRNVETDLVMGSVRRIWLPDSLDSERWKLAACNVLNNRGLEIATILTDFVPNPEEKAAVAVANYEEHNGYPDFEAAPKNPDHHRIERLLGKVLADTAAVVGLALSEYWNGGLKTETKSKFAELIAQLHAIWYASRFGSYDSKCREIKPYFANTLPLSPRMSFSTAAQHYGLHELRTRLPDVPEATLQTMLSWPINLFGGLLDYLLPPAATFKAA